MSQIGKLSARTWEKLLKDCGVDAFNGAQGRILYVLWEQGQLTITDIAKQTSLAKTTLTSMLDRMEAVGLVERIPDKTNRRQTFVAITEKAKQYREKYDKLSDDMNGIFYKGFTDAEITELDKYLRRILENFESEGV